MHTSGGSRWWRRPRRRLAIAIMGATFAAAVPPVGAVAGFGDVEPARYYTDAVQWMVDEGITTGTSSSCFSPDGLVTRGQLATFLWRLEGEPVVSTEDPFEDVLLDWQVDAVAWLFSEAITVGTSPTTFSPNALVTRGEFAAMLHRLADPPTAPAHSFGDITRPWQQDPVSWLNAEMITTGTSATTFSPDLPLSRAQLATFLHRYRGRPTVIVDALGPSCGGGALVRQVVDTAYEPFAGYGEVTLTLPADRIELIGFHESGNDGARQLELLPSDVPVTTMLSRGRGTGSRTAADVVVHPDAEIRSPVTGTVLRGGGYDLYCDLRDEFVVIEPDDAPGWEVKILHFEGLRLAPGDRVIAAETVVGDNGTILPFVSQVDLLTASPSWPHVHIEIVDPSIPDRPGGSC